MTTFGKVKCKEIIKPNGEILIEPENDEILRLQKEFDKTSYNIRKIINSTMAEFQPFKKLE